MILYLDTSSLVKLWFRKPARTKGGAWLTKRPRTPRQSLRTLKRVARLLASTEREV